MSEEKDTQKGSDAAPDSKPEEGLASSDNAQGGDHVTPQPSDEQVNELREALLRTRAEMDNLEKRTQRELEKARKFMFEGVFRDLLPVIDSLDRGLETAAEQGLDDEGLALTRKLLLQTLERHGLEVLSPEGESFDPQWHEAMSAQPNPEVPSETILMVMQKGYRLNDRLLRPARVVISSQEPSN